MRMDAYYYSFESTGNESIDRILSAVAHAGKSFHHTESWTDDCSYANGCDGLDGNTPEEWIQNAANAAARDVWNQAIEKAASMIVEDGNPMIAKERILALKVNT